MIHYSESGYLPDVVDDQELGNVGQVHQAEVESYGELDDFHNCRHKQVRQWTK